MSATLRHRAPFDPVLASIHRAFHRVGFAPRACAEVLVRIAGDHGMEDCFDPGALLRGECPATERLLFDAHDVSAWTFRGDFGGARVVLDAGVELAEFAGQLLFAWCTDDPDFLDHWHALGRRGVPGPRVGARPSGAWGPVRPGITRREHASVLFDSGTTRIVTDPQGMSRSWTTDEGRYPADVEPLAVDAVCVTHSHDDHLSLPSIIACCREGTRTIVPRVERSNLLSFDQRRVCETVGLDACDPQWGDVVRVGDIDVEILPFYGEQPTKVLATTPPGVRNWGNCLRFQCAGMSAVLLADSGEDPAGVVFDALRRSVAQFGPVDVLMSCCASFPEVINSGLPSYSFTQPFELVTRTHADRRRGLASPSITFGPDGVAQACRIAGARWFLPYAHGFDGLGVSPRSEPRDLEALDRVLRHHDIPTRVVPWQPGDRCSVTAAGELKVERICGEPAWLIRSLRG